MSKIILTEKEKEEIKPIVDELDTARVAFSVASAMIKRAERRLWKRLKEKWPYVVSIDHGDDEDWAIIIDDLPDISA